MDAMFVHRILMEPGKGRKNERKQKNKESSMAKMCGWMSVKMNIWAVITEWVREVTLDNA